MLTGVLDRIVLAYVLWRLERFQKIGDLADRFADRLAAMLADEVKRRNVMLTGWDADLRRAEAMHDFKVLEHQEGLHLQ